MQLAGSSDAASPGALPPAPAPTRPARSRPAPSALARTLRSLRLAADLTLEGLAERSGVSTRTISDIERGVSLRPRHGTVRALSTALDLDGPRRDDLLAAARALHAAPAGSAAEGAADPADRARSGDTAPYRLADFRGREDEIARLVAAAGAVAPADADDGPGPAPRSAPALVVLSGTPGVGKSTIAVEAAHRLAAGSAPRLFVDLGGTDDAPAEPLHVVQSLLRQLTGSDEGRGDLAAATAAWARASAAAPVVVVLDDAAGESQVRPVMAADPRTTVLVTSRRSLAGLAGARHLHVGLLPRADGIALLRAVIPAEQRRDADLDELAGLCGDLPLALRVAGYRIASQPAWSVDDGVRRLRAEHRRLSALVAGDTGVQAAFATSCAHLTPPARDLFRSLALLRGSSFAAPMAGATLGLAEEEALELLDELVELGMVETLSGGRHRIHDLLRLYADERLRADVDPDEVARRAARLARWTLATAAAAGRLFSEDGAPPPRLGPALAFADVDDARAWLVTEADAWSAEFAAAADDGRDDLLLAAFPHILHFADRWFEWGRWDAFFALAAEVAERAGDAVLHAEALNDLSFIQMSARFEPDRALATAERALAVATASGDTRGRAWALAHIAGCRLALGDPEEAMRLAPTAVALFDALGLHGDALAPRTTTAKHLLATDPVAGLAAYRELEELTRDPHPGMPGRDRWATHLDAMAQAGKALIRLGRLEEAVALADAQLATADGEARVFAEDRDRARALRNRGLARAGLGDRQRARADLERALVLAGDLPPAAWTAEIRRALDGLAGTTA